MANLQYGSSGSEVEKLQKALIDAGYDVGSTGADGVFGNNTAAAVKQYQQDNGLTVDGIAGKNTLGALYATKSDTTTDTGSGGANNADNGNQGAADNGFTYDEFQHEDYDPMGDENIKQAWDILQQNSANKPGEYVSQWMDEADSYLNQYTNRDPFSYNFNEDALYQMYKDQYVQQGQMAMMDTMGQAAAMTGGYGNSYAQTAGQQMYNQYLGELNNIIPELSQMAYDRYTQEGQNLLAMYDLYMNRDAQDYARHQDSINNWYQEDARLQSNYDTLYDRGWNEYVTDRNEDFSIWQDDKAIARDDYLQQKQDKTDKYDQLVSMITNLGYTPTDEELAAAGMSKEHYQSYKDYYDKSQKTSSGGGVKTKTVTYKDLDIGSTEYNTIVTDVKRAENLAQLQSLAKQYIALGYNPDQINALTSAKAQEFINGYTPTTQSFLTSSTPKSDLYNMVMQNLPF